MEKRRYFALMQEQKNAHSSGWKLFVEVRWVSSKQYGFHIVVA